MGQSNHIRLWLSERPYCPGLLYPRVSAACSAICGRVGADIDEIVRLVRFPGWQDTLAGEREIKKALRKPLFTYKLHAEEEHFEKAYTYIRQYY